jgi:hypothetical protein
MYVLIVGPTNTLKQMSLAPLAWNAHEIKEAPIWFTTMRQRLRNVLQPLAQDRCYVVLPAASNHHSWNDRHSHQRPQQELAVR